MSEDFPSYEELEAKLWMAEHERDELKQQLEAKGPWTSVKEQLPGPRKKVIAFYRNSSGMSRKIMAEHVPPRTVLAEDFFDWEIDYQELTEYDEATDQEWVAESWHEMIDNWGDFTSVHISEGEVTHWMPLPADPNNSEIPNF